MNLKDLIKAIFKGTCIWIILLIIATLVLNMGTMLFTQKDIRTTFNEINEDRQEFIASNPESANSYLISDKIFGIIISLMLILTWVFQIYLNYPRITI